MIQSIPQQFQQRLMRCQEMKLTMLTPYVRTRRVNTINGIRMTDYELNIHEFSYLSCEGHVIDLANRHTGTYLIWMKSYC